MLCFELGGAAKIKADVADGGDEGFLYQGLGVAEEAGGHFAHEVGVARIV